MSLTLIEVLRLLHEFSFFIGCPVIIRGAVDDWPALEDGGKNQWSVDYLKKVSKLSKVAKSGLFMH